jgi:hypothetical protein
MEEDFSGLIDLLAQELKAGRIDAAITRARDWLAASNCASLYRLLEQARVHHARATVLALLADLLSNYPRTLIACPVLLHATPDSETPDEPRVARRQTLTLPQAHPLLSQPEEDLYFLGWVPPRLVAPQTLPLALPEVHIPWGSTSLAIALFQSKLDADELDLEQILAPSCWWGELFFEFVQDACLSMCGRRLLRYPQAIEAGRAMLAAVQGEALPSDFTFLEQHVAAACWQDGICFQTAA